MKLTKGGDGLTRGVIQVEYEIGLDELVGAWIDSDYDEDVRLPGSRNEVIDTAQSLYEFDAAAVYDGSRNCTDEKVEEIRDRLRELFPEFES